MREGMKLARPLPGQLLAAVLAAAVVLAAACGGGQGARGPSRSPDLAEVSGTATKLPPPVDPHLEARRAYANPGGMWMPQQMYGSGG